MRQEIEAAIREAVSPSAGHFQYESGDHGNVWLDLDGLLVDLTRLKSCVETLHRTIDPTTFDVVCGPLNGGAFIACLLAEQTGKHFLFAEQRIGDKRHIGYVLSDTFKTIAAGKRVLVVDDAINAGAAVKATASALSAAGGRIAGFACIITFTGTEEMMAQEYGLPFHSLLCIERSIWPADVCPACKKGRSTA